MKIGLVFDIVLQNEVNLERCLKFRKARCKNVEIRVFKKYKSNKSILKKGDKTKKKKNTQKNL